jgi:predicted dehydrogenase
MDHIHNIAVVGCGGVSDMHFAGYNAHPERVRVVAACDPVAERREWAEAEHGVPRTVASIDELLAVDGWDVAIVCTPSGVRRSALAALAGAGKHILVEKPLADTYEEAAGLVRLCADAGVRLAVNQNFRDHYAFGIARRLVEDGEIGDVRGIVQQDLMFRQDRGWRIGQERHAMAVMGVHWFDGFRQLVNGDATRVSARTHSSPAIDCAGETDAFVIVEFGPVSAAYVQSFSSRVSLTETVVIGDAGTLRFGYDTVIRSNGADVRVWNNPHAGAGKPESTFLSLDRLLTAIERAGEPTNSGADNLKTIALLDAAYRSARDGGPVDLNEGLPH